MATAREVRMRIRSVKNIAKVTGALQTVAASRVRRAQGQALATRAYANAALDILRSIATDARGEASHPLLTKRDEVKKIGVILITSDRGLAGPFNSNVIKAAFEFEKKQSVPVQYVSIGRKGRDMLLRRGASIVAEFSDLPAVPSILDITAITRIAMDDFLTGTLDEVYIAFTKFVNMLRQDPVVTRLLPLTPSIATQETASGQNRQVSEPSAVFSYEPGPEAILNEILPRFTELQLFQALLESLASEHSARMVAMQNATENANGLVDDLTLVYNKARQLAITSEILDIVGGAEALAQTIEKS
jgi:F-type H+-transporting ATPase subunit gamma